MIELQKNGTYTMSDVEKKSIIEKAEREYRQGISVTNPIRRRWFMVERYLEGVQWSAAGEGGWTFTSTASNVILSNNIFSVNVDENVVVDNIMLRIHMTNIARLTRYKPQIEIAPNEKNKENNLAIRKGRTALYDLLYKSQWIRTQQTIARHLSVYGMSVIKVVYDPHAGKKVNWPKMDPETGEVVRDAQGEVVFVRKPEGEVKLYAVNAKNLLFPNNCNNPYEADWIQESNVRSLGYVKRKYNVNVKAETVTFFDQDRNGTGSSDFKNRNEEGVQQSDSCIVKERWYRPCAEYPHGAIIVWASGELLVCKELEKWYPDIPYFFSYNIFNDESVYGDCPAYYLIAHQNEVNRSESNVARHVNLIGKPKLLINRDADTSDNDFTNETGEIVEWSGKIAPDWLLAPAVSQSIYEHIERHVERMMTIGYAHDIMRPGRSRSGNAIAYEQEIDENTMAPMVQSMTDMVERGLGFALQLMARWYKVPRLVKMMDSNAWTVETEFKGNDLFGNFDVRVNFLAGMPANKNAKQQHVIQLFQAGLLEKPIAQKYLEVGEADDALRQQALELEIVENTIKIMERGALVPPHEWDNHEMLISAINQWLRENAVDGNIDPKIINNMEEKLAWHKNWIATHQPIAPPASAGPEAPPVGMSSPGSESGPGPGLAVGNEPAEQGGAPSFQEAGQQPAPEQVLQSGPPGV